MRDTKTNQMRLGMEINPEDYTRYIRNLLFVVDGGENVGKMGAIEGTCFLLKFQNTYYVITTKHGLGDFKINDLKIMLNPYSTDESIMLRALAIEDACSFNGHDGSMYYDDDLDDYVIIRVHREEPSELIDEFFFPYRPIDKSDFANNPKLVVAGYPTCGQDIDYDDHVGDFGATIVFPYKFEPSSTRENQFILYAKQAHGIVSFDGFSGSPVFLHFPSGDIKVLGMVLRATASSGVFNCLFLSVVIKAIVLSSYLQEKGIAPDELTN